MGRTPGCEKDRVKRGQWTPEEDNKLSSYIAQHGTKNWRLIPKNAGLQRCGKSCRLRWTNYLHPDLKHGGLSESEEQTIMRLHAVVGGRWSLIAAQLPGRTDNDVKNYWNTKLKKKLSGMGIDPVTHKPFSHLVAEIATTLPPPHVAHLAEAALGCFKDEMLHLLAKKRVTFQLHHPIEDPPGGNASSPYSSTCIRDEKEDDINTMEKIKLGLSRAIQEHNSTNSQVPPSKLWEPAGMPSSGNLMIGSSSYFPEPEDHYSPTSFMNEGEGSLCGEIRLERRPQGVKGEESEDGKDERMNGSNILFNSDCVLWDSPSDDLMDPIV